MLDESMLKANKDLMSSLFFKSPTHHVEIDINADKFSDTIDRINQFVLSCRAGKDVNGYVKSLKITVVLNNDLLMYELRQCFVGTTMAALLGDHYASWTETVLHHCVMVNASALKKFEVVLTVSPHGKTMVYGYFDREDSMTFRPLGMETT